MKFSQFIELDDTLAQNDKSVKELTETLQKGDFNDDKLLEFFGINKALMSWGVKGVLAEKFKKQAGKVEEDMKSSIRQSVKKITNTTKKLYDKIGEFQNSGQEVPKEYLQQIVTIESKIISMINNSIDKLSKIKTEQIDERIDGSKKLKPSAKIALKYLWEKMMIDAKVNSMTYLIDEKVIQHDVTINKIKKAAKVEDERLKKKAKEEINPKIQELKGKEGKKTETPEGSDEGEKKGETL